ncbi:YjaG family protein [Colwellia sp. MB02u-18]|nr:YjaG family protein [Colwellia sp. MB3u-45]MBA6266734.1 YjaG family protein [Colwellia sp. MB3u-43]MBA6321752.1 YjaG family protein [Colwellia sp. MB02u-19]MBA6324982.1 YjaG family protein [Colwellia sp. MB02u-18]MBA6331347.1 YjaG family protein [Colwellia sp. MB02u-12]MBA6344817.1 YjaG family protein [Colwellia sp. MB02u-1]
MAINLPFSKLSQWQQVAFSAALLERMLPNYQMFAEHVEFGDFKVLRNQLDLIWQWLDKANRCKINYDAQIAKLEEQVPDPDDFDFLGVFPALDSAMALMSLFQGMQDLESDSLSNISKLSENSVSYYVELSLAQQIDEITPDEEEIVISAQQIAEHPLMQWEIATQNELFEFLTAASENKASCLQAKAMVLEEGLSNLGIDINA